MIPLGVKLNLGNGLPDQWGSKIERHLSDLTSCFLDSSQVSALLEKDDPLVYEVFQVEVPREEGQLLFGTSIVYPGKVSHEYFMTKGHYHEKPSAAEVYFCLKGEGYLIMESPSGEISTIAMQPGSIGYVPPQWAHRTVNSGEEPFICFYCMPADAGHDYEKLEKTGFKVAIMKVGGRAQTVPVEDISENPAFSIKRKNNNII